MSVVPPTAVQRRYFILHGNIFSQRDWDRFGCDCFVERGYEVIPVELLELLRPGTTDKMMSAQFTSLHNVEKITNLSKLDALTSSFRQGDLVLCAVALDDRTAPVFRALSRYKVPYMSLSVGRIPTHYFRHYKSALSLREYVHYKKQNVLALAYRFKRYCLTMFGGGVAWAFMRSPRWWVRAGSHYNEFSLVAPKISQAEIISVRSFDAQGVDALQSGRHDAEECSRPYAVIVDDGFFDHPDFTYLGTECPLSQENFSRSIHLLINRVKTDIGLDVIVAGHPKSSEQTAAHIYGNNLFVQNKTADLVANSALVIACCSTAISFAVRLRKPVIFITTDELEKSSIFRGFVSCMSSWLGEKRVNIDHLTDVDIMELPTINENYYRDYEVAFLAEAGAGDETIWERVALQFENYTQLSS
ncbi:hypothetical protein ACFL12_03220 [Pseudomonadota bacterium]